MDNFPRGLASYGVPLIGTGTQRFYGMWGRTPYFVDFDHGSDSDDGLDPTHAVKNLATAISRASAGDAIYIRPRDVGSSDTDPSYITPASATNWNIPRAKFNLAIIGAGPQLGPGQVHMTYLRGHASVTTATLGSSVLTCRAPYTSVENLAFHLGGSTRAQLEFYGDGTSSHNAWGSSASNCLFRFGTTDYGGIYAPDVWYVGAYGCTFYRNQVGWHGYGSSSTIREQQVIGCTFSGSTAVWDACVAMLGDNTDGCLIHGNRFNCGVPALSAGIYKVYITTGNVSTGHTNMISHNWFNVADFSTTTSVTMGTGTLDIGNYDSTNALIA